MTKYRTFFAVLIGLFLSLSCFTTQANKPSDYHYNPSFSGLWILDKHKKKLNKTQVNDIVYHVYARADQHKIDPLFLLSIINTESSFNTKARSSVGALGLMQVLPKWHKDKIKGRDITKVSVNIEVGTKIIDDCLKKHKDNVEKGLYCYLGGRSKSYVNKIYKTHSEIKRTLVEQKFTNQLPIIVRSDFKNPRLYHKLLSEEKYETLIASI